MKRILIATALACALSGSALASDMPTVGAAAPCGDMPSCGAPASVSSGTQSSAVVNALLTVIDLVVR